MTYYDVLGVTPSASPDEIRQAHRILVKKYHPDRLRNASAGEIDWAEKKFQEIQEAYEMLSKRRGEYDRRLQTEAAASAAREPRASEKRARPSQDPSSSRGAAAYPSVVQTNGRSFKSTRGFRPLHKVLIAGACVFAVLLAAAIKFVPQQVQGSEATPFPLRFRNPYSGAGFARFGGTIRSQTTNVSAPLDISLLVSEGSRSFSGCMAVQDPLSGSGDLSGSYSADAFVFTVNGESGRMKFTGKGRDGELTGTYSAVLKNGKKESGTFEMDRIDFGDDFVKVPFFGCQTDEEVNDQ